MGGFDAYRVTVGEAIGDLPVSIPERVWGVLMP